jgi:hypothetical protein
LAYKEWLEENLGVPINYSFLKGKLNDVNPWYKLSHFLQKTSFPNSNVTLDYQKDRDNWFIPMNFHLLWLQQHPSISSILGEIDGHPYLNFYTHTVITMWLIRSGNLARCVEEVVHDSIY